MWGGDPRKPDERNLWDVCWLGDDLLPGIVDDIEIDDNGRDVDEQKAKGNNGVSLKDNGVGAAKIKITFRYWTQVQHEAWLDVRKRIDPKNPGGIRAPLVPRHPRFDEESIKGIYVKRIDPGMPNAVSGRKVVIEAVEWFPAAKPAKTTQKVKPKGGDEQKRQGLPGEAVPFSAVEGLDGLDLGPEPNTADKERELDRELASRAASEELDRAS